MEEGLDADGDLTSNPGSAEFVKIELSTDGGATWLMTAEAAQAEPESTLVGSTPSDGSQAVNLPAVTSTKCRVRITWLENAALNDISNANFSLVP